MNEHAPPTPSPVRTLFLASQLGHGGMTRYLVELTEAMSGMGHAIRVLTVDGSGIARFRARLEQSGSEIEVVARLTRRAMADSLRAHRAEAVKLFTGAFPPDTRLAIRLAGTGVPIVESIHSVPARTGVGVGRRLFYALRRSSRYGAVVFDAETERLVRTVTPARCIHRLRYGMRIPEPGRTARDDSDFRFVTVCRQDERAKDVSTLLRAFSLVREGWGRDGARRPHLTVVGDGPDLDSLTKLSAALGVRDRVAFTGWVDDPVQILRESDVFVLSTRRESLGRVNIEASAVGLPVIASRVPGCLESVDEGVSGLLVDPGDARALADAMLGLARDERERARLAQGGPEHALRFDIGAHAERMSELIAGVCARA